MLTEGPNYIMIRRAIFGKVHGHGVKKIWLISEFRTKHTGVASKVKIVFAPPGLARFLGYGDGVINNEFLIYSLLAPKWLHFAFQRPISYFLILSNQNLCSWCNTDGEVSRQAESWKTPTPLRSKQSMLSKHPIPATKDWPSSSFTRVT